MGSAGANVELKLTSQTAAALAPLSGLRKAECVCRKLHCEVREELLTWSRLAGLSVRLSGGQGCVLAVEVPSSLLREYCAGLHLRGAGGACSRCSRIAGGMVASCSTRSISGRRSQTSFLGDSLCSLLTASEAGGPGGSRAVCPGEEKVAHVTGTWLGERGGHLLLAGSGQLPRQRESGR